MQIIGINKGIIERKRKRYEGKKWVAGPGVDDGGGGEGEGVQPLDICN